MSDPVPERCTPLDSLDARITQVEENRRWRWFPAVSTIASGFAAVVSIGLAWYVGSASIKESKDSRRYEVKKLQSERFADWRKDAPFDFGSGTWDRLSLEQKHHAADYWDRLVLDTWKETERSGDDALKDLWKNYFAANYFTDALGKAFFRHALNFLICDTNDTFDGQEDVFLNALKEISPHHCLGCPPIHWPDSDSPCPPVPADVKNEQTLVGQAAGCLLKLRTVDGPRMVGVLHLQNNRLVFSPPAGGYDHVLDGAGDRCFRATAERETLEETGLFVQATREFTSIPTTDGNEFHLFECQLWHPLSYQQADDGEVAGIILMDPWTLPDGRWRFPEQVPWVRESFEFIVAQEIPSDALMEAGLKQESSASLAPF